MKVIILAGGLGTRLSEETETRPKPMVLIDDKPILWHIMNSFSKQEISEFILALGYRSDVIKSWLTDLSLLGALKKNENSDSREANAALINQSGWKVTALETGLNTQTGGRIAQCMGTIPGERVIATYGDGLANVSFKKLIKFHEQHGKLATVTAVRPPARFGDLQLEGSRVAHFGEKNQSNAGWINGGYFVLEPEVAKFIFRDDEPFETGALPRLVEENQLMAYQHYGFWQPMDTLRERNELSAMAKENPPPWLRTDDSNLEQK
jgi:glucose-1-phosphate cytidylyltransferase